MRHAKKIRRTGSSAFRRTQCGQQILLLDLRHSAREIQPFLGNLRCDLARPGGSGDGLWQLIETYATTMPAAHCHGMFDGIFEFPNVPRPEISLENIHDVRVEIKHHRPHLQGKLSQEVLRQRFDIAGAFPQGTEREWE